MGDDYNGSTWHTHKPRIGTYAQTYAEPHSFALKLTEQKIKSESILHHHYTYWLLQLIRKRKQHHKKKKKD